MKKRNVLVGAVAGLVSVAGIVAVVGGDISAAANMVYTEGTVSADQLELGDVVYDGVTITDGHCFEVTDDNFYYCSGYDQPYQTDVLVQSSYQAYNGNVVVAPNGWVYVWRDSVVDPCMRFMANAEEAPQPELIQAVENPGCAHEMDEWVYVSLTTEDEDAYMSQICSKCGCLGTPVKGGDGRNEASAYWFFGEKARQAVLSAEPNATVEVSTKVWMSFSKDVLLALSERNDVTLVVTYKNPMDGYTYKMEMKGTEQVPMDEQFYGFVYLSGFYKTTVVGSGN